MTTRLLLAAALALAACSPPAPAPGFDDAAPSDGSPQPGADAAGPGEADASRDACTSPSEPGCDCDPLGQHAAYPLLLDDLAQDRGQVEPAPGFDAAAWRFESDAYRQEATLANDRDDASFVVLDEAPRDVLVHVTAASTEIDNFGDDLRQVLVTARAESSADGYRAVACGIDLLRDGDGDHRRVIAASLSGTPASVDTEIRDLEEYGGVSPGQEFDIRMELQGGDMICRVTVEREDGEREITFVPVGGFSGTPGAVGFHTRESQASFRNLRVCGL